MVLPVGVVATLSRTSFCAGVTLHIGPTSYSGLTIYICIQGSVIIINIALYHHSCNENNTSSHNWTDAFKDRCIQHNDLMNGTNYSNFNKKD